MLRSSDDPSNLKFLGLFSLVNFFFHKLFGEGQQLCGASESRKHYLDIATLIEVFKSYYDRTSCHVYLTSELLDYLSIAFNFLHFTKNRLISQFKSCYFESLVWIFKKIESMIIPTLR